jgi:hypothetical protein
MKARFGMRFNSQFIEPENDDALSLETDEE